MDSQEQKKQIPRQPAKQWQRIDPSQEDTIIVHPLGATVKEEMSMENKVTETLITLGMPPSADGFRYTRYAVMVRLSDLKKPMRMMDIYADIAKEFNTTTSRAERCIRQAAETVCDRCGAEMLGRFFGNTISPASGKVPNAEFVAVIAERIGMGDY